MRVGVKQLQNPATNSMSDGPWCQLESQAPPRPWLPRSSPASRGCRALGPIPAAGRRRDPLLGASNRDRRRSGQARVSAMCSQVSVLRLVAGKASMWVAIVALPEGQAESTW
jgi:hypothetical protein